VQPGSPNVLQAWPPTRATRGTATVNMAVTIEGQLEQAVAALPYR
jgi:hypothetical protein